MQPQPLTPNGKKIGTTQYYSRNVNGETTYQSLPNAGNDPYGFTNISKEQYASGLQGKIQAAQQPGYMGSSDIANWQKQIADIQSGAGANAEGYVDPSMAKFDPNAPTISSDYLKPEFKAQHEAALAQFNTDKAAAAINPAYQTASTPAQQQADKFKQIHQQLQQGGTQAPASAGAASAAVTGATPPPPPPGPNTGAITTALQGNNDIQMMMKSFQDMFSPQQQQQSLAQQYEQMMASSGLPALNTQLMNMKNVIDGTEDDIRNEITKAGGFATDSQVLGLTNARNKTMIQNYNNLLNQKTLLQDQVNTMIGLAQQDRQFAQSQLEQQMNIGLKLIDMQQSMVKNAQDSMANNIKMFGAKAVYDAALASGDPTAIQRINQTMGPGFDIKTVALTPKTMTEQEKADLAYTKAQTANLYSQIGERGAAASSGIPEKILTKIQSSPEYKTINQVLPSIQAIKDYANAVDKYGTFEKLSGKGRGEKDATYGNAIASWKTLAGLGALSGADFGLAENVIPAGGKLFTRNSRQKTQLNTALDNAVTQAENLTTRLTKLYPQAGELLNSQLDDVYLTAYPDKYTRGPDGLVYEVE